MLGAADDQHLLLTDRKAATTQVPGDTGPLMGATTVGLIPQQGFQVTAVRQLPQGAAQQFGLAGKRGIVEVEVEQARGDGVLVDSQPGGQRGLAHKSTAAGLAAD